MGAFPLLNVPFAFREIPQRPALTSSTRGLLIVCGVQLVLFLIFFLPSWLASRASTEELLLRWRPGWSAVPLGIGYSVAIRLIVGIVVLTVIYLLLAAGLLARESIHELLTTQHSAVEKLVDVAALRNNPAYFWLTITFNSFVVAGLREELWRSGTLAAMRALWPNVFGGRDGQLAAVALIALLFGAGHLGMGMLAAAAAGLLGFLLGAIMVIHKSIWPAVIAHGFFDATTFALLPWSFEHFRHLH